MTREDCVVVLSALQILRDNTGPLTFAQKVVVDAAFAILENEKTVS